MARTSFPILRLPAKARIRSGFSQVRFEARELWSADADLKLKVSIEAFEPFLEHVTT